jgi:hypothetical protein
LILTRLGGRRRGTRGGRRRSRCPGVDESAEEPAVAIEGGVGVGEEIAHGVLEGVGVASLADGSAHGFGDDGSGDRSPGAHGGHSSGRISNRTRGVMTDSGRDGGGGWRRGGSGPPYRGIGGWDRARRVDCAMGWGGVARGVCASAACPGVHSHEDDPGRIHPGPMSYVDSERIVAARENRASDPLRRPAALWNIRVVIRSR